MTDTSKEEIKFSQSTLSDQDLDVLSGMLIIFLHAAEKVVNVIETNKALEYMAGNEYKYYCRMYGKARTDEVVKQQARKVIRGDKRLELGNLLATAKKLHQQMEKITNEGMTAHSEDISDVRAFDAIEHDANFLVYMYGIMGNVDGDNDEIKLISTLKAMAKGHRVSDNLLSKLEVKLQ